jgi:hypothetical protein
MKLLTRDDIETWAKRYETQGYLPYLISKLVRETTPKGTLVDFPSGSAVNTGGWDGIVYCNESTPFVPEGCSLWELSTQTSGIKDKAERDYQKRVANPLGFNPKESVFIFVTPACWEKKNEWINEKNNENIWKEIRVYDSLILEQWFDISLTTSRWFSSIIGKYPADGMLTAEEYWEEWSEGKDNLKLTPKVIVTGREKEQKDLYDILQGEAKLTVVKASTKQEAIAFIIGSAKLFPPEDSKTFFSKSLVINDIDNFRAVEKNSAEPFILIFNSDDTSPLLNAVKKGFHVLVPLGGDDELDMQSSIVLPPLDRNGLIEALIESGVEEGKARKCSFETSRDITLLRKMLDFPEQKLPWLKNSEIREIIPALLLGKWNDKKDGDIELIEKSSGMKYSEYEGILYKWKNYQNAPIQQINNIWRLTSPLNSWTSLSQYITGNDLDKLEECFRLAFFDGNPTIDSDEGGIISSFLFKEKKYSEWSRAGLAQSLILVGLHGKELNMPYAQAWVDGIIHDLLYDASGELWISVNKELPLIAEASPKSFLKALSHSLEKESPEIMEMFKEEKGLFGSNYHYTGLLWALEGLAWFPEYLNQVGLILLKLDRVVPELKLVNHPMNSLIEIFIPWHYQTLSPFENRMEILKNITSKEPESGWNLLIKLLPDDRTVVSPTHQTRWRIFDLNTNLNYTYREVFDTYSFILNLLFDLFDNDETKFSMLIEKSISLPYEEDRLKVYNWAEKNVQSVVQKKYKPWNSIRQILHRHRSHPDAKWALPENELKRLEGLYYQLEPDSVIEKYKWLFDSYWPDYPEGNIERGQDKLYDKKNSDVRTEAAYKWIKELGLNETIALRKVIKNAGLLGEALADIINKEEDIIAICKCLNGDEEDVKFVRAFIRRKLCKENFEWVKSLVNALQTNEFNAKAISNLLVSVFSTRELWNFVETLPKELQDAYWLNEHIGYNIQSTEDAIYVISKLNNYHRYFSAIDVCQRAIQDLPTDLLMETLWKAVTEEANEPVHFDNYELGIFFDTLYQRDDLDISFMKKIEWSYIRFFDSYSERRPKYLEDELATNPEFFIEVIKWIYFPNDRKKYYEDKQGISEEKIKIIAKQSKRLLSSWYKIPGMRENGSIDGDQLKNWIVEARRLAKESDRLEVTDMEIGSLLSRFPEGNEQLSPEEIFRVIEEINSENLNNNYSAGLFNKLGVTVRGAFDGGTIERERADYFGKLADRYRNKYPVVSGIFSDLEQDYLVRAKQMDDQAKLEELEF